MLGAFCFFGSIQHCILHKRFLNPASCIVCQKNKWLCNWQLFDAWYAVIYNMPAVHTETNLSAISDFSFHSTGSVGSKLLFCVSCRSHIWAYFYTHAGQYLFIYEVMVACFFFFDIANVLLYTTHVFSIKGKDCSLTSSLSSWNL